MGTASNQRFQLIKGLRRSLRMTPPFTGQREGEAGSAEVDRPVVSGVTRAAVEPVSVPVSAPAVPAEVKDEGKKDTAAAKPGGDMPMMNEPAKLKVEAEAPSVVTVEKAAVPTLTMSSAEGAAQPVAAATATTSTAAPTVKKRGTSAWSFAAGLILGVAGSSAAWSWVNTQAAEPGMLLAQVVPVPGPGDVKIKTSPPEPAKQMAPKAGETTPMPEGAQKLDGPPSSKTTTTGGSAERAPVTAPASPAPPNARSLDKPPAATVRTTVSPAPAEGEGEKTEVSRAVPATSLEKWKLERIAEIEAKFPELHPWFNLVQEGNWRVSSKIVNGTHASVTVRTPAHAALLKWLVMEPPPDADTRRAVNNMMVRLLPVEDCLDLWEPLIQRGAPNTEDLRSAADVLQVMRESKLTVDQRKRLKVIVEGK